ncbi:CdaR family protein [Paenibacillus harenae]|uniref:YbbR domain-containing protein n=1 Tax=Paenibacillus harenae TaxID=306543 RepID=A0ABT9U210_PAEHA|nr:CdaR family protein [Paenibacillus harenae]MDQ0113659.1 YbbR domain-containing protein [Paenibacillus harenae]
MDKWLSHPTALKIISLVLALLLWAVVHIDPDSSPQTVTSSIDTKTIEAAKINVEGLDTEKFALTAMEPTVVRIDVQGKLSDLLTASSIDDYKVIVDVSDAKPGIQELPLVVKLPKGIQLVSMSPRTVTVQMEEIVTKTFDLQVVAEGKAAEGFVAGEPTAVTFSTETGEAGVQVTLPKDDMERVGSVVASVNIEGADKTVTEKKAKIVVYDADGLEMTNAIVDPTNIMVEVKITLPFKKVPVQLRYTGTLPDGVSIESIKPGIEEVTVYGDQKTIDGITVYDGVVVDLSKVKSSGTFNVKTQLIDGIKSVDPEEISISVFVDPTETRTFSGMTINIEELAEGLKAVVRAPESGKYDLTVSGAGSVLSKLEASQITIAANVAGLGPGVHTIPLDIALPAYVQTSVGDGKSLSVTIEIVDEGAAGAGTEEEPPSVETGTTPTDTPAATPDPGSGNGNASGNATNSGNQ